MEAGSLVRSICVFCGSSFGNHPAYRDLAHAAGAAIAHRGLRLVYGGGRVGLMGVAADAALAAGGTVIGVIPASLVEQEVEHTGLSELHITDTMHERKALMADLSDGFLALPGGYGTLDELCEILTWSQLGIHAKPAALLGTLGFWQPLLDAFDRIVATGFLRPAHREMVLARDIEMSTGAGEAIQSMLTEMGSWRPATTAKWGDRNVR